MRRDSSNGSAAISRPTRFAGVRYAVFGCGNKDWAATYQAVPRLIDERLDRAWRARASTSGAKAMRARIWPAQFEAWFEKLRPSRRRSSASRPTLRQRGERRAALSRRAGRAERDAGGARGGGALKLKIALNEELQRAGGRSTRHIEVELPEGVDYRVGDHLAVAPRNDPALVDSVARRFGFEPSDLIRLSAPVGRRPLLPVGEPIAVGRLLTELSSCSRSRRAGRSRRWRPRRAAP